VFEQLDKYCEWAGPGGFSEPLNILTGAVFAVIGVWFLRRPAQPGLARAMAILCLLTGITTVLHHYLPNPLTEMLDILPTLGFIAVVFFGYARDVLRLSAGESLSGTLVLMPFVGGSLLLLLLLEEPFATAGYAALPVFILGMAVVLRQRDGGTGFRVMLAGVALMLGLVLRAADMQVCAAFPVGTHFLWHLCAAATVAMLICAYRRHLLAAGGAGR
jgi:hypothetical protein